SELATESNGVGMDVVLPQHHLSPAYCFLSSKAARRQAIAMKGAMKHVLQVHDSASDSGGCSGRGYPALRHHLQPSDSGYQYGNLLRGADIPGKGLSAGLLQTQAVPRSDSRNPCHGGTGRALPGRQPVADSCKRSLCFPLPSRIARLSATQALTRARLSV